MTPARAPEESEAELELVVAGRFVDEEVGEVSDAVTPVAPVVLLVEAGNPLLNVDEIVLLSEDESELLDDGDDDGDNDGDNDAAGEVGLLDGDADGDGAMLLDEEEVELLDGAAAEVMDVNEVELMGVSELELGAEGGLDVLELGAGALSCFSAPCGSWH